MDTHRRLIGQVRLAAPFSGDACPTTSPCTSHCDGASLAMRPRGPSVPMTCPTVRAVSSAICSVWLSHFHDRRVLPRELSVRAVIWSHLRLISAIFPFCPPMPSACYIPYHSSCHCQDAMVLDSICHVALYVQRRYTVILASFRLPLHLCSAFIVLAPIISSPPPPRAAVGVRGSRKS